MRDVVAALQAWLEEQRRYGSIDAPPISADLVRRARFELVALRAANRHPTDREPPLGTEEGQAGPYYRITEERMRELGHDVRAKALEEAARVCEQNADHGPGAPFNLALALATKIRALKHD